MTCDMGSYGLAALQCSKANTWLNPAWHQLIVIGNGFDLECGLNSGFGSFMKARRSALDSSDDEADAGPLHFCRTIWDVILDAHGDSDWCDVEGAIAEWLVGHRGYAQHNNFATPLMDRTLDALVQLKNNWSSDPDPSVSRIAFYLAGSSDEAAKWTKEKLLDVTKTDLSRFEHDFAEYLRDEISKNNDYQSSAGRIMAALLCDSRVGEDDYRIEESVPSFNYTRPCISLKSFGKEVPWINVHGRLDAADGGHGEIVFGIDGTGFLDDDPILPFTKTFRVMGLGTASDGRLVHVPPTVGYMDYGTALIKFYGHSLAQADYSYFQALFDSVRLYDSQTKLIFYYRRHSKGDITEADKAKELAEIRLDTMRLVTKLMASYAETLENKDHGRNLVHKLLVEGRLVVMELPEGEPCAFLGE